MNNDKKYECPLCGKRVSTLGALAGHLSSIHLKGRALHSGVGRVLWEAVKRSGEKHIKQTAEARGAKKRRVIEGRLVCIPHGGDGWILLSDELAEEYYELRKLHREELTEEEMDKRDRRLWEIERRGKWIDDVLSDLEGKKVRITVEVVEDEK